MGIFLYDDAQSRNNNIAKTLQMCPFLYKNG